MLEAIFNSEYVQTIQIGHEIIGAASCKHVLFILKRDYSYVALL